MPGLHFKCRNASLQTRDIRVVGSVFSFNSQLDHTFSQTCNKAPASKSDLTDVEMHNVPSSSKYDERMLSFPYCRLCSVQKDGNATPFDLLMVFNSAYRSWAYADTVKGKRFVPYELMQPISRQIVCYLAYKGCLLLSDSSLQSRQDLAILANYLTLSLEHCGLHLIPAQVMLSTICHMISHVLDALQIVQDMSLAILLVVDALFLVAFLHPLSQYLCSRNHIR